MWRQWKGLEKKEGEKVWQDETRRRHTGTILRWDNIGLSKRLGLDCIGIGSDTKGFNSPLEAEIPWSQEEVEAWEGLHTICGLGI